MTVITVSRNIGSEGLTIAQRVAEELGYRFVTKRTFESILQQYGLIHFDEVYESAPGLWARLDRANLELVSMLNRTMLGIARQDNVVILGRGGYAALSGYADVLHVRIQASLSIRVKHIIEERGLDDVKQAEKIVAKNDKARAMFVQGFYDADFHTATQFHLVLDTGVIPVDNAVASISEAARSFIDRSFAGKLTTQAIEVDSVLADAITKELGTV